MSEIQAQVPIYCHLPNQCVSTDFPISTTTKECHGYAQENTNNIGLGKNCQVNTSLHVSSARVRAAHQKHFIVLMGG